MSRPDIRFGFWNLRGLNDPLKQKEAKSFLKNNDLSLMGLIEHKVKEPKVSRILGFICPHWKYAHNFMHAPMGRILVCWDPQVLTVKVLEQTDQLMHREIHALREGHVFLTTFVYASNSYLERRNFGAI